MKVIYIGHQANSPSFYTQRTDDNIKGYSKSVESGDVFVFDKNFVSGYRVIGLSKRNYNGVFKNPDDAKNAFFDAKVEKLTTDEVKVLNENKEINIFI